MGCSCSFKSGRNLRVDIQFSEVYLYVYTAMILVDTSVLIDFFKGIKNPARVGFKSILEQDIHFGITSLIYQEVLQGAKSEKEYAGLKRYLSSQRFLSPRPH